MPFSKISFHPSRLDQPLHWKKPRRIFVSSMGDLFHEDVKEEWIDQVVARMALAHQHIYQLLTKRPDRMNAYIVGGAHLRVTQLFKNFREYAEPVGPWPLPNIWLGVTAENQATADQRIPILLQTPAAKRFVSVEPMLSAVNLRPFLPHPFNREPHCPWCEDCIPNRGTWDGWKETREDKHGPFLDWVICGGESGPGARPMHPDWPRGLRDQCQAAGVPFFFKQWGNWMPVRAAGLYRNSRRIDYTDNVAMLNVGKKSAGCLLDGREHKEFPEVKG